MTSDKRNKLKVIDLFAGAGGLSYGFEKSGKYKILVAYEKDRSALETYKTNHCDVVIFSDVRDANYQKLEKDFGKIDIVIGGPPCQGFSNANRQRNVAINQNNILIKQFIRAILDLKPKAFVMENVGMLKSEIHRFYMDNNDFELANIYNIPNRTDYIFLLEKNMCFTDVEILLNDPKKVQECIWPADVYNALKLLLRLQKNKTKLLASLIKNKSKNLGLLNYLEKNSCSNSFLVGLNQVISSSISSYYDNKIDANKLTQLIFNPIRIQSMLRIVSELYSNNIIFDIEYDCGDLKAKVKTIAVIDYIEYILTSKINNYRIAKDTLNAAEFGVPQTRERYIILGIKEPINKDVTLPKGSFRPNRFRTVQEALGDLIDVPAFLHVKDDVGIELDKEDFCSNELLTELRDSDKLFNHIVTNSSELVLKRFAALEQGENFHDLPDELKRSYTNAARTQNSIYQRLSLGEPSGTVVNIRKSMWVHPTLNRAVSIREAARLQTFPDSYIFCGSKDSQYQQIGNAVPQLLAKEIALHLAELLENEELE